MMVLSSVLKQYATLSDIIVTDITFTLKTWACIIVSVTIMSDKVCDMSATWLITISVFNFKNFLHFDFSVKHNTGIWLSVYP